MYLAFILKAPRSGKDHLRCITGGKGKSEDLWVFSACAVGNIRAEVCTQNRLSQTLSPPSFSALAVRNNQPGKFENSATAPSVPQDSDSVGLEWDSAFAFFKASLVCQG